MTAPYPQYRLRSGWNALLPARTPCPPLRGRECADVVVVGAGFTGLACARRWQQLARNERVVVIDASEIGEGNPGRNSGFLLEISLAEDADPGNMARMERCNGLTRQAMAAIVEDVQAGAAGVDLQRVGTYRAAAGAAGLRSLDRYRAFLDGAGLPYTRLEGDELAARLGTSFYRQGLHSPDCYLGQPAAVIRAVAARLPEAIAMYENTPAVKIQRAARRWRITTPEGELHTAKLVLANNSFARNLGVARARLAAVFTYAGLTPVLTESQQAQLGADRNWGLLPCHRLGSTLRRTADGRLLIRSLHDYARERDGNSIRQSLQDRLWRRFPGLAGTDFEQVWGGAVGFTFNGAPLWGELQPGLFVSVGCNGGGTVKGTLLGRLLAELAHGEEVPDVPALFGTASWMPPDPLRAFGFRLGSTLQSWQGRHEL